MSGQAIRLIRSALRIRANTVASNAGISVAMLSMIESGEREPSQEVVERIAGALGVPVSSLSAAAREKGAPRSRSTRERRLEASIQLLVDAESRLAEYLKRRGASRR